MCCCFRIVSIPSWARCCPLATRLWICTLDSSSSCLRTFPRRMWLQQLLPACTCTMTLNRKTSMLALMRSIASKISKCRYHHPVYVDVCISSQWPPVLKLRYLRYRHLSCFLKEWSLGEWWRRLTPDLNLVTRQIQCRRLLNIHGDSRLNIQTTKF